MGNNILKFIFGKSLKSAEIKNQKFNVFWGLPVLASDAISSVAYAGEAILVVLIGVLGIKSYEYMFYVALCIAFLLFLLIFSYRQTIDAYPNGGGSYIVAKDNLGTLPGLIAGTSLSIDYILTVAVSTCAGTEAITSAFPSLIPHKVIITIALIVLMTIGNLRGVKESAKIFGLPTYVFIVSILSMIVIGIVRVKFFGYVPEASLAIPKATGNITIFLFLRAFASGCTALTGIEAVSNGIPNFSEPSQHHAKMVLELMGVMILLIFGGLSFLTTMYHPVPNSSVTVIAQISQEIFGASSFMYYFFQASTAIILVLAANTAFSGFPLLLALIAKDGYAPRQFSKRGNRLGFSNGIVFLAMGAILLVWVFKGDTQLLLPLYAVGVFISFTLSQVGMLTRWVRLKVSGWKHKALINGVGALFTFVTVIVIGATKFVHGAWVVFILIPFFVSLMLRVKKHYSLVAKQLKLDICEKPKVINLAEQKKFVIVPIDTLNRSFLKALNYARTISDNIIVFHVSVEDEATEKLMEKWEDYNVGIPLVVKKSPYRNLIHPLLKFIESEEYAAGHNDTVTVVIAQFVIAQWWGNILHNQTSLFIKGVLLKRRNIAIVTIPYIIAKK